MKLHRILGAAALIVVASMVAVPAVDALDKDDFVIHGFGGWAYGLTDGNRYLIGDSEGKADNVQFSLNLTVTPSDRVTIVAQVDWEQADDDIETELDYAFVELALNDNFDLRLGRVKHPFGIYAEIFDVGTLRPFFLLPQSIYGPQGLTSEHYDGIGLRGRHHGEAWGIEWDLYAGEFQGDLELPGLLTGIPEQAFTFVEVPFEVDKTIGGRINVFTPIDGLVFGVSAYEGDQTVTDAGASSLDEVPYFVAGAHVEYLDDVWSVRAEYSNFQGDSGDLLEADGYYIEIGFRFAKNWQVAARIEDFEVTQLPIDFRMLPPFARQFLNSEEIALGINYWVGSSVVIRLNLHQATGNRFAFPDSVAEAQQSLGSGMLEEDTELLILGAQFSF